jgi:hypothetical protein
VSEVNWLKRVKRNPISLLPSEESEEVTFDDKADIFFLLDI